MYTAVHGVKSHTSFAEQPSRSAAALQDAAGATKQALRKRRAGMPRKRAPGVGLQAGGKGLIMEDDNIAVLSAEAMQKCTSRKVAEDAFVLGTSVEAPVHLADVSLGQARLTAHSAMSHALGLRAGQMRVTRPACST
jgi:hypothetical protein